MSVIDEDDKPTVQLDLKALRNKQLKQEEELASIASDLEFRAGSSSPKRPHHASTHKKPNPYPVKKSKHPIVVLFDFESTFFGKALAAFPKGYHYEVCSSLGELNKLLKQKPALVVFNYDVNPKAVNQLTTQIKQKCPDTLTVIMATSISEKKAKVHAATPAGAHGYYQFPLIAEKIEGEFQRILIVKSIAA